MMRILWHVLCIWDIFLILKFAKKQTAFLMQISLQICHEPEEADLNDSRVLTILNGVQVAALKVGSIFAFRRRAMVL